MLAFEAGAEAQRFALVLKAQGFYEPTPRRMDVRDLEAFCASDERISLLRAPEGTRWCRPKIGWMTSSFRLEARRPRNRSRSLMKRRGRSTRRARGWNCCSSSPPE